jgi:hypothetical protein
MEEKGNFFSEKNLKTFWEVLHYISIVIFYADVITDYLTMKEYFTVPYPVSSAFMVMAMGVERIFAFIIIYQSLLDYRNRFIDNPLVKMVISLLIICVYLDPIYLIVFHKNEDFAKRRRM